ncbi:MAG: transposase [Candidatus Omnitrophota bacterium]|nr:transposase [Candidatus Omnitrophota bacterium]
MTRKENPVAGEIYHVFNKSIAGFRIFQVEADFVRMRYLMRYYQYAGMPSYAHFGSQDCVKINGFDKCFRDVLQGKLRIVDVYAFCIMPTHIHLVLKPLTNGSVAQFMGNILNSYSKYFNFKYDRQGPLWTGPFKNVLVETEEQLLHLIRYIHLNPAVANLVSAVDGWQYSSYREYLGQVTIQKGVCSKLYLGGMLKNAYQKFVEERLPYQKELALIKHLVKE